MGEADAKYGQGGTFKFLFGGCRAKGLIARRPRVILSEMKHVPSLVGVIILFGIVYFLTEATLTALQMVFGVAGAALVYSVIMAWHICNLLR